MNRTLQWKVASLLGYVAVLMMTLVMGSDGELPVILRLAAPL
ncbi:hypothetical protein IP92_02090 [Pseudoduganella flava]|uniref:Uncharacterized protein n=1 Tax=Pseudoduganella flava TaxID=871742 RepID=A0A562PWC7_9BURK|nr:hypothetical protein [Pseudoduganella flava]TWI48698.1 hypothetical protein IP92_02090 [Pseudoduganella flava]